jgi:fructose-specific phosphotransferase system IIA component
MLSEILSEKSIKIGLEVSSKQQLLEELLVMASESGRIINSEQAMAEIIQREKIMSTGIGNGIALPHAKTNAVSENVGALAILSNPIDYEALDSNPVNIVFMLLSKDNNVSFHLKLLSSISKMMNNPETKHNILNATSSKEILEIISKY